MLTANILILVVFGLVMLFSASYAMAYYRYENSYKFIAPQLLYAVVGVGAMFAVSMVDYHWLRGWTYPVYGLTITLLVAVLVVGTELNGCKRWLFIGVGTIQPSEVAKFAIILLMAHLLTAHQGHLKNVIYCVIVPLAFLAPIVVLLRLEPHNSAIVLMAGLVVIMMWCGGVALRWFVLGGGGVLALGATYMLYLHGSEDDYASSRLQDWIASFGDLARASDQTRQSVYSIGNGGLTGVGIGNSNQKVLWLSEPQNDFIFAILCEELGFLGAVACVALFAALIFQNVRVALNAPDRYGALLGVGIAAHISMQVVLNIAVTTNLIPNTGISLPFFSSGGTSLVMILGEMGILLSIARAGDAARRDAAAGGDTAPAPGGPGRSPAGRPAPQGGGPNARQNWRYSG
ncbi:MAG: cell division protein FtsW [Oscillospiraceae bacterium]|nr:cell division protein FtsW [Oscillospiraceae bacterium]